MIISPPFLPAAGLTVSDPAKPDPMMDAVDRYELSHHGVYPIAFDRRWHGGLHLVPDDQFEPVRAIADGDVVAYRVSQNAIPDGQKDAHGNKVRNCNNGFVLLKHTTETGEGRTLTFYSLYMHLMDIRTMATDMPRASTNPHPKNSTPADLAEWLATDTGGIKEGGNRKVHRKDILGYVGRCHDYLHLHFEIFMTEEDFKAWFEQEGHKVQLGEKQPVQPTSTDYWGHTYFVIPGGQVFLSTPPGHAGSPYFPEVVSGTLDEKSKLYVEAWFSKGERYTCAWLDKGGDGQLTLLTPEPVRDRYAEYEYKLYERAKKLYPACPSDGYDLIRFGRILSASATSPDAARATYVAVPFDEKGTLGYVNVNQSAIVKLSDADFPFFMGWRKIDSDNTPFGEDGLCGYDKLCKITGVVETHQSFSDTMPSAFSADDQLAAYVQDKDEVRNSLKGFVCHAYSEWDASKSEERYKGLNEPDGFFGQRKETNPNGYRTFLDFLKQFQFLDQTPLSGGKKFWFFHPLAFIRHFRKCLWIGKQEVSQLIPARAWFTQVGQLRTPIAKKITADEVISRISPHLRSLNETIRKYSLDSSSTRIAIFLAQTYIETDRWNTFREYGRGEPHPAIPMAQYYAAFYGRGIMQLTWASNYEAYGEFKMFPRNNGGYNGESRINQTSTHYWDNPPNLTSILIGTTPHPRENA
jgi:hypothetical protein